MATHDFRNHAVYVKQHWGDQWTAVPNLFAERVTFCLAPEMPEAILSYSYGEVMGYGEQAYAVRTPLNYGNWYVSVAINQGDNADKVWYGIILDDSRERHGDYAAGVNESGRQILIARGLEYLLHRKQVVTSSVLDNNENVTEINAALAFNCGSGHDVEHIEVGNMATGDDGLPRFAKSLEEADKWTNRDVLRYLIKNHSPTNPNVMSWSVANIDNQQLLDALAPAFHCHGLSVGDIINRICDRRRLMSWYVTVEDSQPAINVITFNSGLLNLPDGTIVPANANSFNWNFEADARIEVAVLGSNAGGQFTQVIVQGERATGTVTLSDPDIEADWTTDQQDGYEEGASTATGYAGWDDFKKMHAHQRIRQADKFQKVYRYFRIKPDWDGLADGGALVCPIGENERQATFWWPGLRLLPRLPLQTEKDYSVVDTITDAAKDNTRPEYRRPFAILEEYVSGGSNTYSYLDRTARGHDISLVAEQNTRQWAATMRPQETMPGFILDVHGAPQHVLADGTFTACDTVDEADYRPEIDWRNCRFTICLEYHEHAEGRYPTNPQLAINGERDNVLILRAPHKRADYLSVGTVIDVDKNGALMTSDGGWIQDDREELANIARSAYEWYSEPRASVEITQNNLDVLAGNTVFDIGWLLGNIGRPNIPTSVNCVINKLTFDLRQGKLSIATAFSEFDFVRGLK